MVVSQPNDSRPLPPEIYQRRRILAVVVIILVVALVWWLVSTLTGGDDETDPVAQETTQETTAVETAEPSETAEPTETGEPSADPSEAPEDLANKETCELDDLQIEVRPGAPAFPDGDMPNFFLEVTNPTAGECDIDLGDDELRFEVFTMDSGYTRVWGDTDCNDPTSSGRLRLDADQSRTFEMTAWSRTTSSPDNCDDRQPVDTGAYMVYGHIGDNTSESQTFNLA